MAGYKTWAVGEEVLAADHNSYLQSQVVARFPSASARTAQLPAPGLNQLSMRDDAPGLIEYWTGSAWAGLPRRVGFGAYNPGQAVANGATTPVTYTAEEFDTDSIGAAGSVNLVIPAGLSGIYSLQAYIEAGATATAPSRAEWVAAGSKVAGVTFPPGGGGVAAETLTTVNAFNGGTTIFLQIINGNAVPINYSVTVRLFRLAP
jgi:hypothetical protein